MNVLTRAKNRIVDTIVRRRYPLQATPLDRFQVRVASTTREYLDAFSLLQVAYAFQGIVDVRGETLRMTPQHALPEATVFVAYEGDQLVGTLTVTADSPAGLPLDHDYPEQLGALRRSGARMVEYGSLAVVKRCWHSGVFNLLSMAAYYWSYHVVGASHIVIGVHPKATPYFRGIYGFRPIGEAQAHNHLRAPVQGLALPVEAGIAHMRRTGRPIGPERIPGWELFALRPPACVSLPKGHAGRDAARQKMPRETFRELFVRRSDHLKGLDATTRRHLNTRRSRLTLGEQELRCVLAAEQIADPTSHAA